MEEQQVKSAVARASLVNPPEGMSHLAVNITSPGPLMPNR